MVNVKENINLIVVGNLLSTKGVFLRFSLQLEFAINWSEILDEDRIVESNFYSFLLVIVTMTLVSRRMVEQFL